MVMDKKTAKLEVIGMRWLACTRLSGLFPKKAYGPLCEDGIAAPNKAGTYEGDKTPLPNCKASARIMMTFRRDVNRCCVPGQDACKEVA